MPELGTAGPEDQAAQGDGGHLGLDRELVAVRLEEAGQPAVQLGLRVDDELRRPEVLLCRAWCGSSTAPR